MRPVLFILFCLSLLLNVPVKAQEQSAARFVWVDVYIDAGAWPLAAYQIEFQGQPGAVTIVGVEGGEHAAFADAPYYDPAAISQERAIIAAFSTKTDLPSGKTRIARIHLRTTASSDAYTLKLQVAATARGTTVPATASLVEGEAR